MTTFLMDERALIARIGKVYSAMVIRARPRLWKSGRKRGKVRIPGITSLPFTRDQLWQHALAQVGAGVTRCPYCEAIGRPANLITLANCVLDHRIPVAYGGTWTLDNLVAICADCNNCKGKLNYLFFIGIMAAAEKWNDPRDRANLHACLRTHGTVMRLKFGAKKPMDAEEFESQPRLALQEDF
jgi:5-methylcytosine-specific restriction endonuclease McrA